MSEEVERESKPITIRGMDQDLYKQALAIAKQSGKTVGEVINEALEIYLTAVERFAGDLSAMVSAVRKLGVTFQKGLEEGLGLQVKGLEELTINKNDLEALGKPVRFRNIGKLVFADDVDVETLKKYVALISNCSEVVVPAHIPKLLVLAKCRNVKSIRAG